MATKTFKLRFDFELLDFLHTRDNSHYGSASDVHQWLWDTHVVFNAGVDYLAMWLLRMHRGAGVWRERKDGIWDEWKGIATHAGLIDARAKVSADPERFALVENRELLAAFTGCGMTEAEAVELAECCRAVVSDRSLLGAESEEASMDRSALDLLTDPDSEAKGVRPRTQAKSGATKKVSGKRPGWQLDKAICEETTTGKSLGGLCWALRKRDEFRSAVKDGRKKLRALIKLHRNDQWSDVRDVILEADRHHILGVLRAAVSVQDACDQMQNSDRLDERTCARLTKKWREAHSSKPWPDSQKTLVADHEFFRWEIAKRKAERNRSESETSGALAAYRKLLGHNCLPVPGLQRPADRLKLLNASAEWNYGMWDMAGQRVRSHLGWVRRRAGERLLWEKRKKLFNVGGWIRTHRNGKAVKDKDIAADDIVFTQPTDVAEFAERKGFGGSRWITALREYEQSVMPTHLQRTAFAAGEVLHLTYRTIKGWAKVRDKWRDVLAKDSNTSQDELVAAVNKLRTRKSREFGDPRVFEWLAHPDRRWLWDGSDGGERNDCDAENRDYVSAFAAYNNQFSHRPESITFTQSHATQHPVWAFFGENSAVKYTVSQEKVDGQSQRLVLCLAQLLARQADGSYQAKDKVRIPLRGYRDFESSFSLPDGVEVTAKQELIFKDDLLAGASRAGTLSGIKIMWDRGAMESAQGRHNESQPKRQKRDKPQPPASAPTQRVYAAFSCDAGEGTPSKWLGNVVYKSKKPRDGMTDLFSIDGGINRTSKGVGGTLLPPGQYKWPKEAVEQGFTVRGTDLGFRTSSAGAWWRLTFTKPDEKVAWPAGVCDDKPVYAVLDRKLAVSLPGDGEEIPQAEQLLRDRLRALRTRLNLNNMLLGVARLLLLDRLERRVPKEPRLRLRGGVSRPNGTKWATTVEQLAGDEIKYNCRKAGERLLVWSEKDSMADSLKAIGFDGSIWQWLEKQDGALRAIAAIVPKTVVPSEKEAKDQEIDREPLRLMREKEEELFGEAIYTNRIAFARVICNGHDAEKRRRGSGGLWAALDGALRKEVSYGDKGTRTGKNMPIAAGLLRLLRKPPITKHHDRKDEANNLPHGRTHRGGLSMPRLNFLDEVKSFVRKWSCRPRWPGDVRRLSGDEKFDRQDTAHLDHLREHRAKLIAHADVAQSLGFEQDLRRGVWRFYDKERGELLWHMPERKQFYREDDGRLITVPVPSGMKRDDAQHPHPAYDPAHILVYEDLSRYKMRADRPKNENAGLARWSHRSILKYAQHIGGLFGVPVATVPAGYSSRFCHVCGAPGCRAVRFDPNWLRQEWMRRVLSANDIRDAAMKGVARGVQERLSIDASAFANVEDRPWVLRDGGTHFVCSNRLCSAHATPVNADENAAANIGLWFLRGIDDFRVKVDGSGKPGRPLRFVIADRFKRIGQDDDPFWQIAKDAKQQRRAASKGDPENEEQDDEESSGTWLFRDPSGKSFGADRWYPPNWFWGKVAEFSAAGIKAANGSLWSKLEED